MTFELKSKSRWNFKFKMTFVEFSHHEEMQLWNVFPFSRCTRCKREVKKCFKLRYISRQKNCDWIYIAKEKSLWIPFRAIFYLELKDFFPQELVNHIKKRRKTFCSTSRQDVKGFKGFFHVSVESANKSPPRETCKWLHFVHVLWIRIKGT